MEKEDKYNSIFPQRYSRGSELLIFFSERNRVILFRQLWIWLAEGQKQLGLAHINDEMIEELKDKKETIDWDNLRETEKILKHDVMSHIEIYKKLCPKASGIIHLGATSCFVQDNADLMIYRDALRLILLRSVSCLKCFDLFATKYASTPTVGRTHYQPASFTTVGKRSCIWAQELLMATRMMLNVYSDLHFRGIKGATGTQDSFLTLFGQEKKVEDLDEFIMQRAGFNKRFKVCGQTYSRQQDTFILFALSNLGSVAKKIASDIRLLQSWDEISEPFESQQVGSSAMPQKRNPMKCERICGIARALMKAVENGLETLSEQGLERTLDDSSNRRITMPEAFLAAETILKTLQNVLSGLRVNLTKIDQNNAKELPYVAMEKVLILLTEKGIDRQLAHSKIREVVLKNLKTSDESQADISQLLSDGFFENVRNEAISLSKNPLNFCGRSVSQTNEFLKSELLPFVDEVEKIVGMDIESTNDCKLDV